MITIGIKCTNYSDDVQTHNLPSPYLSTPGPKMIGWPRIPPRCLKRIGTGAALEMEAETSGIRDAKGRVAPYHQKIPARHRAVPRPQRGSSGSCGFPGERGSGFDQATASAVSQKDSVCPLAGSRISRLRQVRP